MYGHHSIAIPLGFIIMAGMLCWHIAHAEGRWGVKLALTVLLIGFGLEVSGSLDSYAGWPTDERMPDDAQLLGAIIREPNARAGDRGAIYVWVRPLAPPESGLFRETPSPDEPRAYRLPYSRQLHQEMEEGMQAIRNGQAVGLHRGHRKGRRGQGTGQGGDGQGTGLGNGMAQDDDGNIHTYALPASQPPRKDDANASTPTQ